MIKLQSFENQRLEFITHIPQFIPIKYIWTKIIHFPFVFMAKRIISENYILKTSVLKRKLLEKG